MDEAPLNLTKQVNLSRVLLITGLWVFALSVAALLDSTVAIATRKTGIEQFLLAHKAFRETLKAPGLYWFTTVVAVIVTFVHEFRWQAGLFVLLATAVSGVN